VGGCGVLYIAVGRCYVKAAIQSAQSVRRWCGGLPIHIFTDAENEASARSTADSWGLIENPHRRSKVDSLMYTPFERTLYLDSDTRICGDIRDVFEVLERFDMAICHAHTRNTAKNQQPWRVNLPYAFPQFNGGVIAYRKTPAVLEFLEAWKRAYHSQPFEKDQVTLRELLWACDLRVAVLPPEYNIRYRKYLWLWSQREAQVKILHLACYSGRSRMRIWMEYLKRKWSHWAKRKPESGEEPRC